MSLTQVRVGIIGASAQTGWAQVSHVPAIQALDGITLAAVATRREESAREAAAAFGAQAWHTDPLAMIQDPSIDIVTVAVKVPDHRDLVLAALDAGKAVYCEAPLGSSPAETQMLAAAARSGHSVIGLQGRYNPSVRRAAQIIAEGRIGRPLNARVVSTSYGFGPASASGYEYFEKKESGASLLTITAGHTLDIIEALLGDITEVDARTETLWPHPALLDTGGQASRDVPDHVDILARTTTGAVVTADVIGGVPPENADFRFEFRGTDGWLSLTGGSLYGVQGGDLSLASSASFDAPDEPAAPAAAASPALNVAELYACLVRDAETGNRSALDFAHAQHNTDLVAAVAQAASSGRRWTSATAKS
ncbi:Gfo/Idh/MocA family oxidoreductase [Streptomyces sp. NPDC094472]|uniref:Gfo/Idh/MocA family protein n=1 Tax=Streptomyces sp. NPDC094472 TaxID=3155080 RepID=UPI00331C7B6C